MTLACVLIADMTGSTRLFERVGTQDAMRQITHVVARMRELIEAAGGVCVKSKGDDTISYFNDADGAFKAAWAMVTEGWPEGISIHAGIHLGEVLFRENEIYGDAVNTAARLSSAAKPGEILIGHHCWSEMSPMERSMFIPLGELEFKGKQKPLGVYSCMDVKMDARTVIHTRSRDEQGGRIESADVRHGDETWRMVSGDTLSVGRSPENDIVLNYAWVSRRHAQLTIRQGQLEFADYSSAGTVLRTDDGHEIFVHRRTNLLTGSGVICLGNGGEDQAESVLAFTTRELGVTPA